MDRWVQAVNAVPLAGYLLVIALGYGLSRITVRGVSLGAAGGTLFVALAAGSLGIAVPGAPGLGAGGVSLGTLGFALFIYSVGYDAAPHFFASFRERRGLAFLAVGVAVNAIALATALSLGAFFDLGGSATAGMLAGALTSGPTYAAASEVATDVVRLSVAFAVTYPLGLVGVVLVIQLVPRWRGRDLARGAAADPGAADRDRPGPRGPAPELLRSFEVRSEAVAGVPLRELDLPGRTGCFVSRLRRAAEGAGRAFEIPDRDTVLQVGDVVTAVGHVDELHAFERLVGPETPDPGIGGTGLVARRVEVRAAGVAGRSLEQLGIIGRFHTVVTRIERGRHWIEPDADVVLAMGDVLEVTGRPEDVLRAARALGRLEPAVQETDLAVYTGGLVAGLLLGAVRIPAFGLQLGLGTAGGLLVVGLLLGWRQQVGPFRTHVPREARQLVRDLGILLFVGETGLHAGTGLETTLREAGWELLASGAVINALSIALPLVMASRLLRMPPVDAWGSIAGGLTSSSALQTLRRAADGNEAAISYAASYAVGSVVATLAGPVAVLALG